MITAIYCETCGRTIPHAVPGLTEHVGHRVAITTRPSASDAAPLEPRDSTLTFAALPAADRRPITLSTEPEVHSTPTRADAEEAKVRRRWAGGHPDEDERDA